MPLFNKHLTQQTNNYPMQPHRGTGRTTVAILRALADSVCKPGEQVPVLDHVDPGDTRLILRAKSKYCFRRTLDIVEALGFDTVAVQLTDTTVTVVNNHNLYKE